MLKCSPQKQDETLKTQLDTQEHFSCFTSAIFRAQKLTK